MGIWDDLRSKTLKIANRNGSVPSSDLIGVLPHTVAEIGDGVRSIGAQKFVEYVPDPDRREKLSRVLTGLGKFAFDSAVNESLKGVTGGIRVYKIVKEGLKDQPSLQPANAFKKPEHTVTMEEMQAKMEKMQEDLNIMKQQNEASAQCAKELDPCKESRAEPSDVSTPSKTDVKKIFIRSRL